MASQFLELAREILEQNTVPMTVVEMWEYALIKGLDKNLKTEGKTPQASFSSSLYVDVAKLDTIFVKLEDRPAKFGLKSKIYSDIADSKPILQTPQRNNKGYLEKDLHPLLVSFAYHNTSFNRGKSILCKTIRHESSLKKGYNEWVHPDIVGFYSPAKSWSTDLIELVKNTESNQIRLFSFELKIRIDHNNYRESFFQALSNSSWAHESYLVFGEIDDYDTDLLAELERLSTSFGIGLIWLNVESYEDAKVLFPAQRREYLDWNMISKLHELNKDFKQFIKDVNDITTIHRDIRHHLDAVMELEEALTYAKSLIS